jgi:hypothetical protein
MNYYDLVLGLIPVSATIISGALLGLGVDLPVSVSAGALFSAGLVGHAMFVRAPVGSGDATDSTTGEASTRGSGSDQYSAAD